MGLLDGGLQGVFAAAFAGIYLDGTLHRRPTLEADAGGSYINTDVDLDDPTTWPTVPIKVQRDAVTERMIRSDGYADKDVRLIVLQRGPDGVVPEPSTDDEITAYGVRWSIGAADADTAQTHWEVRGRRA